MMHDGHEPVPVVAVLFVPAQYCPYMLSNSQPDLRLLKKMEFDKGNIRFEACTLPDAVPNSSIHDMPTLYYFERSPQPSRVMVATLGFEGCACGLKLKVKTREGCPHEIIPPVDSPMARAHIYKNVPSLPAFPAPKAPALNPQPKKAFAR